MEDKLYITTYEHEGKIGYLNFTHMHGYGDGKEYATFFHPFEKTKDYIDQMKTQAQFDTYIKKVKKMTVSLVGEGYSSVIRVTSPIDFSKFKLVEVSFNM